LLPKQSRNFFVDFGMGCCRVASMILAGIAILTAQTKGPADQWNDRGLEASSHGNYVEAERALRESVRLWQELGPQYEGHTAIAMANLAEALCGEGKWSDGVKLLTQSLEMSRRSLGLRHINTVSNMNLLAAAEMVVGELDHASALYLEALALEREHFPGSVQLAHSLLGISSYHVRTNQIAEALPPAEEGLKVLIAISGEKSAETAMAYANVGQVHMFNHQPARALPLLRKAEAIYAALGMTESPRYASVLSQEGLALMQDRKTALADRNLTRALEVLTHCTGCQYLTAIAQSNLGLVRFQEGKYQEADALLTRALTLQEAYATGMPSEMAATLDRLAEVRRKEHRNSDADALHGRALTLQSYR
jgi:tetratricopeptide (TPR) repeat protein